MSSSSCDCSVELKLTTLGTAGCGIEITNGIAYAVGSQYIDFTDLTDACSCVLNVFINGEIPPTYVEDGNVIQVDIELDEYECGSICYQLYYCDNTIYMTPYHLIKKNNKIYLRLSPELIKSLYN